MKNDKKAAMYTEIRKHGENLLSIFPNATIKDPVALCKALRRLEVKAHRAAENGCNGYDTGADGEKQYSIGVKCARKAADILGGINNEPSTAGGLRVFFNGDARGYALKITDRANPGGVSAALYKDWGGYGILAPDFTPRQD